MQKLSKFILFLFLTLTLSCGYFVHKTEFVFGQEPIPELGLPCDETANNEFHSLRPYQAAPCGNAPQALFCSNKLVIFENFKFDNDPTCKGLRRKVTGEFDCPVNYQVEAHNLNVTLDESEFPIMGNTEDEYDDAQKLNEYASWYLNGVVDKKENEDATDEQIVNFSGPVKKLLPSIIQDAQRIKVIESTKTIGTEVSPQVTNPLEEDEETEDQPENHDQIVVDDLRLSSWDDGNLSILNTFFNWLGTDIWNNKYPPLPWQFSSTLLYEKAYNEWLGKNCAILPIVGLQCADTWVSNKWSNLWHYVPLSNNSDSKGKNFLLTADGPSYIPSNGTEIKDDQHKSYRNAPLYFAHAREVFELAQLLNKTFTPDGYKSEKLPETTEKIKKGTSTEPEPITVGGGLNQTTTNPKPDRPLGALDPYSRLDCSSINVRINEGDNLFPGDRKDGKELYVEGAKYLITNIICHEVYIPGTKFGCGPLDADPCKETWTLNCPAQVGIEFKLGTQTPYANEIFSDTVADSGSTFRKIFPKIEEGAPVECIADIPTTTNVTYGIDNDLNQAPNGGEQELRETKYPADGGGSGTQLTFPHVGSVYEYFLKGIQTALRPKGYGEPIANGNCKPTDPVTCGEWEEKLEKSSGGDCGICTSELGDLAKRILATAGKQYNVPAANIWAAMKHEGGDWDEFTGQYTDENIRKWSNSIECGGEVMPSCDNSIQETQPPFGFLMNWFYNDAGGSDSLWSSVQKIDPSRDSKDKVSRCNFLDAAFAAANLLSQVSTAPANGIMGCSKWTNFDNSRPGTCSRQYWTDSHIVQSQTVYAGYCVNGTEGQLYSVEDTISWFNAASCN